MELKGSFCYEGVKGDRKVVYSVRFPSYEAAFNYIKQEFTAERIVNNFWYGFHITDVNKEAKGAIGKRTAQEAYDTAEEIMNKYFPDVVFERNVQKAQTVSPEMKIITELAKSKGLSMTQVAEMVKAHTSSLK